MDSKHFEKTRHIFAYIISAILIIAYTFAALQANALPAMSDVAAAQSGGMIALTFDDGPYAGVTAHILDILEKYSVKATFFILGSRVEGREETLLRIESIGCEIGNHTFSHIDLTQISTERCIEEIESTNSEFRRVLGHDAQLLRPPYGHYNKTVRTLIDCPLVLWTVDPEDWRPQNSDRLAEKVINSAYDGAIILMHDQQKSSAQAIDKIIPALLEKGFTFVTVSELIESRGEIKAVCMPES